MQPPNSTWDFLELPEFKGTLPGIKLPSTLKVSVPTNLSRSDATMLWASHNCKDLELDYEQWDWKGEPEFQNFKRDIQRLKWKDFSQLWPLPEIPYRRARNEADTTVAVQKHILDPVWQIMHGLAPNWRERNLRYSFPVHTSILSEAYSSSNRVRVDKIFAIEVDFDPDESGRQLRGQNKPTVDPKSLVQSTSIFLDPHELWDCVSPGFIAEQPEDVDVAKLKGLVCVELKKPGILTKDNILALKGQRLDQPSSATNDILLKMLEICQQTIRYSYHYGTRYALLTDYVNSVIFRLPGDDIRELSGAVSWAYISPEDNPRLPLAFSLWSSYGELKPLFEKADEGHKEQRRRRAETDKQAVRGMSKLRI